MVRLVKVVADLVRNSRSQLWFWLQAAGEAASHLGYMVMGVKGGW